MTTEEIKAELRALADAINAVIRCDNPGCDYSTAFWHVLQDHPDLGARWDRLRKAADLFKVHEAR